METKTENKVSCLDELKTLGIAITEGYMQQADGVLPSSLGGSMKTLSERLAEGMSNEFYRLREGVENEAEVQGNDAQNNSVAKEFFGMHERFAKYIPGYATEFDKINGVR